MNSNSQSFDTFYIPKNALLHSQAVARDFGAVCTPEFLLFKKVIITVGNILQFFMCGFLSQIFLEGAQIVVILKNPPSWTNHVS